PNTIVVFETGNPVAMPWHDKVKGVVQAWFPGQAGATAIAEVLTGKVNPSGRTPITWPADLDDTPRPTMRILETEWGTPVTLRFDEGAEIGYRWYAKTGRTPLYPFGYGLTYTTFDYDDLRLSGGDNVTAQVTVRNTGSRDGAEVPQLYLTRAPDGERMRLLAFEKVELAPGESKSVTLVGDPRLLGRYDERAGEWRLAAGEYEVMVGKSAGEPVLKGWGRVDGGLLGKYRARARSGLRASPAGGPPRRCSGAPRQCACAARSGTRLPRASARTRRSSFPGAWPRRGPCPR